MPHGAHAGSQLERDLKLLWDAPPPAVRGRPARTTREAVVNAAIARADDSGLNDLSMRSLAHDLDVGVMSLYTQVSSRDGLIALMIDHAFAEIAGTLTSGGDEPWQETATRQAHALAGLYSRHPWALEHSGRLPPGPHVLAMRNAIYETFFEIGLTPQETARTAVSFRALITGLAWTSAHEQEQARRSGVNTTDYWASLIPSYWERYDGESRFPAMARLWRDGGFDQTGQVGGIFDAAVSAYLNGISQLAASSAS